MSDAETRHWYDLRKAGLKYSQIAKRASRSTSFIWKSVRAFESRLLHERKARMKVKPVLRLFHQYSRLLRTPRLAAEQIAEALSRAKLIEVVAFGEQSVPTHYREVPKLVKLSQHDWESAVLSALTAYCETELRTKARPYVHPILNVTASRPGEFRATVLSGCLTPEERRQLGLLKQNSAAKLGLVGTYSGSGTHLTVSSSFRILGPVLPGASLDLAVSSDRFEIDSLAAELRRLPQPQVAAATLTKGLSNE